MLQSQTRQQETDQVKPVSGLATVREWCDMIKIEHTVFALPFALSGMLLSTAGLPSLRTAIWTVIAFAGARSAAMTLNRIIDAQLDARNPRTSMRSIPAGRINQGKALLFAVVSFLVMLGAASQLPPICLWLSPIAIFWLSFYSYTKRFTWLCHFFLGISLGGAALGGWVASSGSIDGPSPWLLALAVSAWVAGFDLLYSCQDIEVDKKERLHSIPSKFGIKAALDTSVVLHLVTVVCLVAVGQFLSLGLLYWTGISIVSLMLAYEHGLLSPTDLSKLDAAFFNVNGVISILAFLSILLDKLIR
jgi:4-hydroxybenzoate polyprenyltransferase